MNIMIQQPPKFEFAGGAVPSFAPAVGISIPLTSNVPLAAGSSTWGFRKTGTINPGSTSYAGPVAVLNRNDLTIAGDLSKIIGSTDLLSSNNTTQFNGVTGGPVTTMGGGQTGLYISNSAGITFNGLRTHVLHLEVNSACTVSLLKGIEPVLTNNAGTISNLRWYDVPDTSATPGGGSITNQWALYSAGTAASLLLGGVASMGNLTVTSSTVAVNGMYLDSSNQVAFSTASAKRVYLNSAGLLSQASNGWQLKTDANASATVPTLIPNKTKTNAGIGADAAGDVSIIADNSGSPVEKIRVTGTQVLMLDLPTANPSIAGALWNNSGVLTVSAG